MIALRYKSGKILGVLAGAGSGILLLAAFGFEFIGGLSPCVLCIWQRWPHLVAFLAGCLSLRISSFWLAGIGGFSALISAVLGIFHTGVERGAWNGLTSCAGVLDVSELSPEAALEAILNADVVACDAVAWSFFGLSMASWNAIFSLVLASIWILEIRRLWKAKKA